MFKLLAALDLLPSQRASSLRMYAFSTSSMVMPGGKAPPGATAAGDAPLWTGHAPNSIRVYARGDALHNRILPVRITGLFADGLLGELVN